jgi:DNA-binding transcriptional MerR regulator
VPLDIRTQVRVYSRVVRSGEVAERAGVNVETLRYYERRGLLPEPARTPRGHRSYDEETVRFVRAIKEAQGLGFTLAEIEEYLRVAARGRAAASAALRVRMAAKIDEIDARLAALRRVREDLARVVGCACDSLDHCTCGAAYLARRGRDPVSGSLLHVTNGDSAGNTLRQTSLGGAILPWLDVLHEGPVPAGTRASLRAARAAFLSSCGWGSRRSLASALERRDRQVVDALRGGRVVVFWFEHDLYDQLQLLDALALVFESSAPIERLELVVVGSFPGRPTFRGLGELTAPELESLWAERRPASRETAALGAEVWAAVRASTPEEIARFAGGGGEADVPDLPGLPFVPAALRRFLEELPAVRSGLSGTERRALEAVAAGAATPLAAFLGSQANEPAPFLGDAWFFRTLTTLGAGSRRLLETSDGEPLPPAPPLGDPQAFGRLGLRLTHEGERVLAGEADGVELLGIDRWVGGTRLVPGAVWRWDAAATRLVAPE